MFKSLQKLKYIYLEPECAKVQIRGMKKLRHLLVVFDIFHVDKTVDINQVSRLTGNLTYSHIISNICLNTARWKGYGSVSDIYEFFDKQTFDTELDIFKSSQIKYVNQ